MTKLNEKIRSISISKEVPILFALKKMDELGVKLLLLISPEGKFEGLITIGDIQRAIIANMPLDEKVDRIKRKEINIAYTGDDIQDIKNQMLRQKDECMPMVDENGYIADVIFWSDLFDEDFKKREKINIPVVIMAGGKGTRMKPLTNVIPKPLIPVGEKTIAENILDRFQECGCNNFYFSVNYKAELITYYFDQIKNKRYKISYFREDKPLGTAGSLFMMKDKIKSPFFVSNCDIIVKQDYRDIYDYHRDNGNEITIVGALKHIYIPYGIIETGENGELRSMREKPEFTYMINAGMYILESHLLQEIPEGEFFHITSLISQVKERGGKVGVFPVSEKQYSDIGEWDIYFKTLSLQK